MGIDIRGYKVIYKDRVYNALNMAWEWDDRPEEEARENGVATPKTLTVIVVNEDNEIRLLNDETFMFKFIRI